VDGSYYDLADLLFMRMRQAALVTAPFARRE
jgi:hypothetical protein